MATHQKNQRSPPDISGYGLVRWLGGGGNATVWAMVSDEGGDVAVKVLRNDRTSHTARARFESEVKVLKELKGQPGIMPLIQSGSTPDGLPWYSMPISKCLGGSTFTFVEAVSLVREVAGILAPVHGRKIFHRDLKPDNLYMLSGGVVVGDWGLVRHPNFNNDTKEGSKIGAIHYLPPELLGVATQETGDCADVYMLGKLLWVFATGQKYPMPGEHVDIFALQNFCTHPAAASVDLVLRRAARSDKRARLTLAEFSSELGLCLKNGSPEAPMVDLGQYLNDLVSRLSSHRVVRNQHQIEDDYLEMVHADISKEMIRVATAFQSITELTYGGGDGTSIIHNPGYDGLRRWKGKDCSVAAELSNGNITLHMGVCVAVTTEGRVVLIAGSVVVPQLGTAMQPKSIERFVKEIALHSVFQYEVSGLVDSLLSGMSSSFDQFLKSIPSVDG